MHKQKKRLGSVKPCGIGRYRGGKKEKKEEEEEDRKGGIRVSYDTGNKVGKG